MTSDAPAPFGIDPAVATAARIYDYWLGGQDNFAADRIAALKITEAAPEAPLLARQNRAFLGRAVGYLAADAGVWQFLDLGTGLPTRGNVHQIAQRANTAARVVYADNDPSLRNGSTHTRSQAGRLYPGAMTSAPAGQAAVTVAAYDGSAPSAGTVAVAAFDAAPTASGNAPPGMALAAASADDALATIGQTVPAGLASALAAVPDATAGGGPAGVAGMTVAVTDDGACVASVAEQFDVYVVVAGKG